ncbi:BREX system ATP-binding protein BrxD [Streptomyces sp. NBC_00825]|uniref:BREX system ATP-binding protein BrxD n=1 Tax=Streptomyces sanglieri TaxID=193460 RepID=A0ABW2WW12_9ACTN|nr:MULTISPECIES: BREX system ATP-binding protein BrxD [unclassified Streptomyces]WTB57322.1 BREX system ATP-binding protein BrxD [Streptomyces sp. NBC_00826]WTH89795.1 BREX system ATP-binding protein BrxD [Streptomyces sp. NBC_00825]WTH98522.1 BREX system ATP-binding protein BrxD [Streptomyces sp. NBC_00822]MCX4735364.1 BREX system ATP-binding protein BrxD [Streptomyces sp. NBC_01363]MCX4863899.1 BREX system ATP-binding protein BrxD [Streptomyces sp. NBC_00906]
MTDPRSSAVSAVRRRTAIDALRRGAVPESGLDLLATGLDRFESALDAELDAVASGASVFKAVRGEYGSGKTFFTRWLGERAKQHNFAVAEIQVSETETPLHKLETVYRRLTERLSTSSFPPSALRPVVDAWFYALEEDALAAGADEDDLSSEVEQLLAARLTEVSRHAPSFASALRGYRSALVEGDEPTAAAILAWLGGQPHVAAAARRSAGVRGDLDHFGALGFLQGLLTVLRDSGHRGLFVVLDEVETLQRVRSDARDKALNALRQLIDEVHSGRFPGLYLVITGTPAFYDGQQGVQRLAPLAQRLATDFTTDPRFDNPRAVQLRLSGFTQDSLTGLGITIRDLYATGAAAPDRIKALANDAYVADLAQAVGGALGGKVGVAPRLFLKKLVGDVLDRIDQFEDFDPRQHYRLTVADSELTAVERNLAAASSADGIDLEL